MGDSRIHTHHALQLVLAAGDTVTVSVAGEGEVTAPGLLIDADLPHRVWSGSASMLFVDRESRMGEALAFTCVRGWRVLTREQRTAALGIWPQTPAADPAPVLALLGVHSASRTAMGFRADSVRRVIESLPRRSHLNPTLAALAREASLSASHFRHRVRAMVGMPLRPYLRWLRLQRALMSAAAGADLSRAAQDAGFADGAHLTRTMQRHFGIPPMAILDALRTP
jgi:AraC-like DNA-binding protein